MHQISTCKCRLYVKALTHFCNVSCVRSDTRFFWAINILCLYRFLVMPVHNSAYAVEGPTAKYAPWQYTIREPLEDEVLLKVAYCGICHSDIHCATNDWGVTKYPFVGGHEFTGHVVKVGDKVTKFREGDRIGVGCVVGSCLDCSSCKNNREQYCPESVDTFTGFTRGERTYGGYGKYVVVRVSCIVEMVWKYECVCRLIMDCEFQTRSQWTELPLCSAPGSQPTPQ